MLKIFSVCMFSSVFITIIHSPKHCGSDFYLMCTIYSKEDSKTRTGERLDTKK